MNKSTYHITGANGNVFRVEVRGLQHNMIIDINTGAFGTITSIAEALGIHEQRFYTRVTEISPRYPSAEYYIVSVGIATRSRLCSQRLINEAIDQCIERRLAPPDAKARFNKLYKELHQFCLSSGSNATAMVDADNDTSVSLRRIEALEQTVARLTRIIDRLLEEHPEITIDEPVIVDKALIDNYIVAVCKNEDGSLIVETLDPDDDLTDKDPLFSKEFYVSINDVDNLLTKLHDKEIVTSINEETITVDDADFFISAFSYKLSKISDKNKESEVESTSASTSP